MRKIVLSDLKMSLPLRARVVLETSDTVFLIRASQAVNNTFIFFKYPSPECHPVNLIQESLGRTENEG
jgi:hypothetical protein